jgi:hypothetical protein
MLLIKFLAHIVISWEYSAQEIYAQGWALEQVDLIVDWKIILKWILGNSNLARSE